ncbi:hypothetical protein ACJW30_01G155600 [Castanea mollissima]
MKELRRSVQSHCELSPAISPPLFRRCLGGSTAPFYLGANYQVLTSSNSVTKLIDIAALLGKSMGLALVDCFASSETIGVMKQVVDLGCCIVMANKKPLTSTMEDYDKLVSHPPL